jgi:hypothetical protein
MTDDWNSKVDVLKMYVRLHRALDVDDIEDLAEEISLLSAELATKFARDTGTKAGRALGWDKHHLPGPQK